MKSEINSRSIGKLFWGRSEKLLPQARVGALAFIVAIIAAMSFCQFGFLALGVFDDGAVYLILVMVPVIVGALAFSPIAGGLLGLYGGIVAFIHAYFLPLDFLEESYFGIPLNTIVLFPLLGLVAGALFGVALKRDPQGGRRAARIIAVSFVVSLLASASMLVNMVMLVGGFDLYKLAKWYMGVSYGGSALQAICNAVVIAAFCLIVDYFLRKIANADATRSLYAVFRNYLMLVSAIVFMLVSPGIFSGTTIQERNAAEEGMDSALSYLQDQFTMQQDINAQLFVGGYDKEIDGVVFTTSKYGVILASNDGQKFKVGTSVFAAIDMGDYLGDANAVEAFLEYSSSLRNPVLYIQDTDDDMHATVDLALIGIRKINNGYVMVHRTSDMIFANRASTMVSSTALAWILITAIAVLATVLMRSLIGRRIDETNSSLARITEGHLDERVPEQTTREFASLADGINTTVSALGDMISEVERRNEQDLATAKTIQESSLPTVFPPFPEIDKFDIFACMKTAKEVGGDFYDFFLIEDTTKVGFVMADVSGKGIPAALFMMGARSQLRNYMETGMPLNEAVDAANHHLCIGNDAGMFVTCWVAELDYETGELAFVNGGHNPPMLLHDDAWRWVTEVSGMPLGLFDGIPYRLHTLQLTPGDMIYTYTDGVTEAMSVTDELYGEDRLEAMLSQCKDMGPRSLDGAVRSSLAEHTRDAEQSDDITTLILKYGVPPEPAPAPASAPALPADSREGGEA